MDIRRLFLLVPVLVIATGNTFAQVEADPQNRPFRVPTLVIENVEPAEVPLESKPNVVASKEKGTRGSKAVTIRIPIESPMVRMGALRDSTGNPELDKLVLTSATRNGVDPKLIIEVMRQESGFNPNARSYKGACGLMQLMPATARRFGVTKLFDPAENIEGGARYLRFLLSTFSGDVELVLAGYNAGEGAVISAGYRVPRYRETMAYVRNVTYRYGYSKHSPGLVSSETGVPPPMMTNGGVGSGLSNNY